LTLGGNLYHSARTGLDANATKAGMVSDKVCPRCKNTTFRRINRIGFLQRVVLPWLGFFPWECVMCRRRTFFHDAGHRPSERGTIG
jgi:hypothetical protein